MFGRRGPGLVRAAATTAVVAGTAGAVRHRQDQKYAAQDQAAYDQQMARSRRLRNRPRRPRPPSPTTPPNSRTRAAEEPGDPQRRGVRGEEEADPRHLRESRNPKSHGHRDVRPRQARAPRLLGALRGVDAHRSAVAPRGARDRARPSVGGASRARASAGRRPNLVIHVPATPGREGAPTITLQGHLDMVFERTRRARTTPPRAGSCSSATVSG